MKDYFVWYDNGSGYFEGCPNFFPVQASLAEEALKLAGGPLTPWGTAQLVTGSKDHDPNNPSLPTYAIMAGGSSFNFAVLDPRNLPVAVESNAAIFQNPIGVLGIEITVPALATRCMLGNIDPQHTGGDATLAAIELALNCELPPSGATLATVRVDLDSISAMVVLNRRGNFFTFTKEFRERVEMIAASDKFVHGDWKKRPLPTKQNPWEETTTSAEESYQLAAIAAAVADFKVPLAVRVATMEQWLLTGTEPEQYRVQVECERADMIAALEGGAIEHVVVANGRIALVKSTHRAGTSIGYSLCPVVIALNPAFKVGGGEPHRKFTVCQFAGGYVDLKKVSSELNVIEFGTDWEEQVKQAAAQGKVMGVWGGSPTIIGSPQGVGSNLTIEQMVEVVTKHLLK